MKMPKLKLNGAFDLSEFSKMSWFELIKSFFLVFIYGILGIWIAIFQRFPALVYKLIGLQGVAIAVSLYVVSKGQGASLAEILGSVTAFGVSITKSYFDQKQFGNTNNNQENNEPKN